MNLPKKKYYTLQEISTFYNISEDYLKSIITEGFVTAVHIEDELVIPRNSFDENYFSHNINSPFNPKNMKKSLTDQIRSGLVYLIVALIIPVVTLIIYIKIVGFDYFSTETGGLIGMALVVVCMFISYIGYKELFSKYSDDLPDKF